MILSNVGTNVLTVSFSDGGLLQIAPATQVPLDCQSNVTFTTPDGVSRQAGSLVCSFDTTTSSVVPTYDHTAACVQRFLDGVYYGSIIAGTLLAIYAVRSAMGMVGSGDRYEE
jgi:hypothetical protein